MEHQSPIFCIFSQLVEGDSLVPAANLSNSSTGSITQYAFLQSPEPWPYSEVYQLTTSRIVVIICVLGLLGNLLAFLLLMIRWKKFTGRQFSHIHSRNNAKSDVSCLIAISLSDFCFCVALLPQWFMNVNFVLATERTVLLVYEMYEEAIINTCVLSSTWLTVSMTINRYIHLSHPMWALRYLGQHFPFVAILASVLFSVIFNIPRYWLYELQSIDCIQPENTTVYFINNVPQSWSVGYHWAYFVVGILIPLCSLVYSNTRIVIAVCRSKAVEQRRNQERHIITRTLIFVVFFYICFLSPAEFIKFFEPSNETYPNDNNPFLLLNSVANLLQAINFAFNFVPYLILDKTIRQSILDRGQDRRRRQSGIMSQSTFGRANGYIYEGIGVHRLSVSRGQRGGCVKILSHQTITPFSRELTRISPGIKCMSISNTNNTDVHSLSSIRKGSLSSTKKGYSTEV